LASGRTSQVTQPTSIIKVADWSLQLKRNSLKGAIWNSPNISRSSAYFKFCSTHYFLHNLATDLLLIMLDGLFILSRFSRISVRTSQRIGLSCCVQINVLSSFSTLLRFHTAFVKGMLFGACHGRMPQPVLTCTSVVVQLVTSVGREFDGDI
jgi:hypothetical protein